MSIMSGRLWPKADIGLQTARCGHAERYCAEAADAQFKNGEYDEQGNY